MARSSLISVTFVYASFSMSFSSNKDKVFISLGNDANMVNAQVSKPSDIKVLPCYWSKDLRLGRLQILPGRGQI